MVNAADATVAVNDLRIRFAVLAANDDRINSPPWS
jgi:hypothetical protein